MLLFNCHSVKVNVKIATTAFPIRTGRALAGKSFDHSQLGYVPIHLLFNDETNLPNDPKYKAE